MPSQLEIGLETTQSERKLMHRDISRSSRVMLGHITAADAHVVVKQTQCFLPWITSVGVEIPTGEGCSVEMWLESDSTSGCELGTIPWDSKFCAGTAIWRGLIMPYVPMSWCSRLHSGVEHRRKGPSQQPHRSEESSGASSSPQGQANDFNRW